MSTSGRTNARRFAAAITPLLLVAACGGGSSDGDAITAQSPVATVEESAATGDQGVSTEAPSPTTQDQSAVTQAEDAATSTVAAEPAVTGDVLGPDAVAAGTPVKLGLISLGAGQTIDATDEARIAEATVAWLNERGNGIGGHPIELVVCEYEDDLGRLADCGNEMVREGVVAVVSGAITNPDAWRVINEAGIPYMAIAGSVEEVEGSTTTFVLSDPNGVTVTLPLGAAQKVNGDKVTVIVFDVPGAADQFRDAAGDVFAEAGVELSIIPVPPGTADMTSQLSAVAGDGTDVVYALGIDAFCIAAFNALSQTGYEGEYAAHEACISDAFREALPGEVLDGMQIVASAPLGVDDPSMAIFDAVVAEYGADVAADAVAPVTTFTTITALHDATAGLTGQVTAANVAAAIRSMPEMDLRAAGELRFRCNGKAQSDAASCTRGVLVTVLDSEGRPNAYVVAGASPVPD